MAIITASLRSALAERARRRAAHDALSRLSDHALEDIGLNRADVDIRFG